MKNNEEVGIQAEKKPEGNTTREGGKEMADWLKQLISALVNITVKLIEKWLDIDINGDGKKGL